ncbi:hypothetical protein ACJJTC_009086 [Scirpophaga incertulas]
MDWSDCRNRQFGWPYLFARFQERYQLDACVNIPAAFLVSLARKCGSEGPMLWQVLKGIIGYSPGHFVAFCRRSNNQWELHNDLSTKEVRITHDPTITPTAAIFIRRDTAVRNQPIKRKRTEE